LYYRDKCLILSPEGPPHPVQQDLQKKGSSLQAVFVYQYHNKAQCYINSREYRIYVMNVNIT